MNIWDMFFEDDKEIAIWGAGREGKAWYRALRENGRKASLFIDKYLESTEVVVSGENDYTVDVRKPNEIDLSQYTIIISPIEHQNEIYEEAKKLGGKTVYSGTVLNFLIKNQARKKYPLWVAPGHFYSPYADISDISTKYDLVKNREVSGHDGIDINDSLQCDILKKMDKLFPTIPVWAQYDSNDESDYRYRVGNGAFCKSDALLLHFMLRIMNPKRLIEVGSGYSSAVTLDTNEFYLDNSIQIDFIEPYPQLLKTLRKSGDELRIHEKNLQDIELGFFEQLESGDVLFIDSTHVSKFDSDVNYLFFNIIPRLKSGVIVHLHDIFYPWEYPLKWLCEGRAWNEMYILRAFLQNNRDWEILYFNHYMAVTHPDLYHPKWRKEADLGGGSFWMRKR